MGGAPIVPQNDLRSCRGTALAVDELVIYFVPKAHLVEQGKIEYTALQALSEPASLTQRSLSPSSVLLRKPPSPEGRLMAHSQSKENRQTIVGADAHIGPSVDS